MNQFLLEGEVDNRDSVIEQLRLENQRLSEALVRERLKNRSVESGLVAFRKQTLGLLHALQAAHGLIEGMGLDGGGGSGSGKWEVVKQRLSPRLREAVDIFLTQGHMKRTQLASAMRMDYSNCTKNVIAVLLRQGLLVDNGGQLSLKEL